MTAPVVLEWYEQGKLLKDTYILIPVEFTAKQFEQEATWENFVEHYMLGYEFWSAQSRQKDEQKRVSDIS